MIRIAVIGAGIVGATIAYELSKNPQLKITVFDEDAPASASTGAALGVLMGVISQKTKGRAWELRNQSIKRYQTLIPELEKLTGIAIPHNCQGILMLLSPETDLEKWVRLKKIREQQGWELAIWQPEKIQQTCPQIKCDRFIAGIYSPQDRQINPTVLTEALIAGAAINGVDCQFGVKVQDLSFIDHNDQNLRQWEKIQTTSGDFFFDRIIISAGLGSSAWMTDKINPVLGQALHLQLEQPLGNADFQPVITADDIHLVPINDREYWLGATVEFPTEQEQLIAHKTSLEQLWQRAVAFCPALADAKIIRTWSGKRPRPEGVSAPIICKLPGCDRILVATGHYRNGVLLAPATAAIISELLSL